MLESFLVYLVFFYIVRHRKIFCLFLVFSFLSLFAARVFADAEAVAIRIGKHQEFIRIVFSVSEDYVRNAVVKHAGNAAVINFPSNVNISYSGKEPIKNGSFSAEGISIEVKGNICTLNFKRLGRINVFRLSSPSRIVVDAYPERGSAPEEASDISPSSFVLDPGHGGYDYGIRGKSFIEKDFVLSFVKELSNSFEKKGKKVLITRKGDYVLSLKERTRLAGQKNPDMFISVHVSSKNEFSAYSAPQDKGDVNIVNAMLTAVKKEFKINTRHERLPIALLLDVNTNALLIELPNPDEFYYDKKSKEKLINIILNGLSAFISKEGSKDAER